MNDCASIDYPSTRSSSKKQIELTFAAILKLDLFGKKCEQVSLFLKMLI